jgi:uncharacterized membrane protein YcaP (DUF421 family)
MDSVVRVFVLYAFLLLLFRIAGKRTLAESTPFDFLVLLIISETTQQAMVADDHSLIGAFIMISTLVGIDIGLSLLKQKSQLFSKVLDDVPLVILENGRPLQDRMARVRVDEDDVLEAARELHGLEQLRQIKYAVLERNGAITIVPQPAER